MKRIRLLLSVLPLFVLIPVLQGQTYQEIWLTSSYDGAVTRSVIMEPDSYTGSPCPLVITLHGMGGDAWAGIAGFGGHANDLGWLAASPDTHGENDPTGMHSLAARAMQHDVLDLIEHMTANWSVDADRVYLTGASMGGMGTAVVAAKYPQIFAAAADWFGPADLAQSYDELWWADFFQEAMEDEIGGPPSQFPEEYSRRSPLEYARNLRHLPFIVCQGKYDFIVPPHHALDLSDEIKLYDPNNFYGVYWTEASHYMAPRHYKQTLQFLGRFTRLGDPPDVILKTDEDHDFYWISVVGSDQDTWRTAEAVPDPVTNELVLATENMAGVIVDAPRASLDPLSPLSVVFSQDCDSAFSLSGLDPASTYTVQRNGSPWQWYTWDPGQAVLEVTVPLTHAGSDPFLIE